MSYDTVAVDYAELLRDRFDVVPLERAMLGGFADLVRAAGGGPVADLGCGPGLVTAHLATLGLDAFGVDLSPGMIAVARRDHPALRFEVGSMVALDLPDGGLAGLIAWWSTIHVPTELLPTVFAEFSRVLAPGGLCLLGFHVGAERRRKESGYGGHPMALDVYLREPDLLAGLAADAGFVERARLTSEPVSPSTVPQACLLLGKPAGGLSA